MSPAALPSSSMMAWQQAASVYRTHVHLLRPPPSSFVKRAPPRALGPEERSRVLDVLRTSRFVDLAPAEIYAILLDGPGGQPWTCNAGSLVESGLRKVNKA